MRVGRIASWGLSLGLAAALVGMVGLPKLIGPDPNPIFALIAGRSGIALFEPYLLYATGAAELAAALLLIWPRSRQIGALLASAITLSAIGFHLSPWLGVELPNMADLMVLLQQGKSVAEIDAMALPTDHGALFMTALAFLAAALATLWLERSVPNGVGAPVK